MAIPSPVVEVLVGPIASGKSTYAKKRAEQGWVILNDDALVLALHGGNYQLYSKELKPLYKSTENHILATALAMGKSVVVDRGLNCASEARKRIVGLTQSLDAECRAVVFEDEGPEVHAQRRSKADSRGESYAYWLRVANAHQDRFQSPEFSEGFARIRFVTWGEIQSGRFY